MDLSGVLNELTGQSKLQHRQSRQAQEGRCLSIQPIRREVHHGFLQFVKGPGALLAFESEDDSGWADLEVYEVDMDRVIAGASCINQSPTLS